MAQNRGVFSTTLTKLLMIGAAIALSALAGTGSTIAQSGGMVSQDPYVQFEASRRARHTTLFAPRQVGRAHQRWLAAQATAPQPAPATAASVNPSLSAGTNVDIQQQDYQGETAISINPFASSQLVGGANTWFPDPNCPVPAFQNGGTLALYGSTDGGSTWKVRCAPWPSTLGPNLQNTEFGSDPALAWDSNGNAYAAYLLININCSQAGCDNASATDALEVAKSTDSGASWKPLGTAVNSLGNTSLFEDKDLMAIDTTTGGAHSHSNRIYVIWDEINSLGDQVERVAHSDDGVHWTVVPVETQANPENIGGALAIGPDGTVYAIWNRLGGTESTAFARSTDGGNTWSAPIELAAHNLQSFGANTIPAQDQRGINAFGAIAADRDPSSPQLGNLYVVYTDYANNAAANDTDIFLKRSTDGGSTWSAPLRVNDDSTTRSQFFAGIDVDQSSGKIAVSWYDARNDTGNKRTQIYAGFSSDGGNTFQGNVQVSQPSAQFANSGAGYSDENSHDNVNFNPNQYGDYAQAAFLNGIAHPIWCDTRNFFPASTSNAAAEDAASAQVALAAGPVPAKLKITQPHFAPQITLGGQGGHNQNPVNLTLSIPATGKGALPIQIQSIQLTGDFHLFPNTPPNQCIGTLRPGVPCSIPMAFSPTAAGVRSGTLTVVNNSTNPQRMINLKGVGVQGKLTYAPRAVAVSRSGGPQPITLTNNNPVPLSIGPIVVSTPDFVLSGTCMSSTSIAPNGGSCQLNVTFHPSGSKPERGTITIPNDAAGNPHHVRLIGRNS